ncbi:MAG: putative Histidine kinase [Fibrobacteres bacterium]|nr:putative Histidine kinase [Fibrobacterota bacterium]
MLHRIPKVLIVDDEPSVLNLITDVLRMNGYPALTARNGKEALELCEGEAGLPDLLVTDVVMPPYFNGVELVKLLRAHKPDLRVLYVSAYAGDPVLAEVFNDVLADFLPKPLSPIVLAQRVERILDDTPHARDRDALRQRGTILLCVAEPNRRHWIRENLRSSGFWVLDAAHTAEAQFLGQWHDGPIHLLLCDPPAASGRGSWHKHLEEFRPGMEVIFIDEDADQVRLTPDIHRDKIPELWENVRRSLGRSFV